MIKTLLLFCFIFISIVSNAQILDSYPKGSEFYKGGDVEFYKQFHNLLLEKKLKPCDNKNEFYNLEIVVYPDSTIKFVKQDSATVSRSKCSFEITRIILRFMKDWNPVEKDGQKYAAVAKIPIYMDDLFENYTESYVPEKYLTNAEFEGGINDFRKKVANSVDMRSFSTKASLKFTLEVSFLIDTDGKMQDVKLSRETDSRDFNEMVLHSIKSIKKKWKPATFHGIPIKSHFRLPLTFNFD